ncbi:MAG: UDP-glucose/GDP-mannose dehydrogenase family protein [Tenuifilaceae bacterium]|nr:UDP-glucose/GDP-mannose dehydrogenase family protein [Tenuifilaceae bacterium]
MKISIVGTGYVGLVTGSCFAETGLDVTCVDTNSNKIEKLKQGIIPIYEPGLDTLVAKNMENGKLHFTTNLADSLKEARAVFIAVGTPTGEDGSADLQYVLNVAKEIGMYMHDYLVVVNKSTVPIGTAVKVKNVIAKELSKRGVNIPFDVASNPEFLKEGDAINDFLKPERIIIGVDSEEAEKLMSRLYKPFLLNGHPIIFMDIPSAELTKYAANAMLATRISFMNDMANLCEIVGADVNMVRNGIGSDSRIGNKFIYPGVGYGGSCFPKDVKALIKSSQEKGYSLKVIEAVEKVNDTQKIIMFNKISDFFNGDIKGKSFAIWGLSFKPNTDDVREAPSLAIISKLLEAGAIVKAYDPVAIDEAKKLIGTSIEYAPDPYTAVDGCDALVLVTEWREFRVLNFAELRKRMKGNVIFDGRNIYEPEEMREEGYNYISIGRKPIIL